RSTLVGPLSRLLPLSLSALSPLVASACAPERKRRFGRLRRGQGNTFAFLHRRDERRIRRFAVPLHQPGPRLPAAAPRERDRPARSSRQLLATAHIETALAFG